MKVVYIIPKRRKREAIPLDSVSTQIYRTKKKEAFIHKSIPSTVLRVLIAEKSLYTFTDIVIYIQGERVEKSEEIIPEIKGKGLAGDLRSEPLHDMNRGLDQLQGDLYQHRHAEATRAYACQQQPEKFINPLPLVSKKKNSTKREK